MLSGRGAGHRDDPRVFAWKYRASNTKRDLRAEVVALHQDRSRGLDWCQCTDHHRPGRCITYKSTHALDPYRPLESDVPADHHRSGRAMDWKWLFIYPEHRVSPPSTRSCSRPTPRSTSEVTSDAVMNSFFIPGLGGQIYAMAGMHDQAAPDCQPATPSSTASPPTTAAPAFTGMKFKAIATTQADFDAWVQRSQERHQNSLKKLHTPPLSEAKPEQSL
jgi:cytochrome o ubiquinol oxidase subunit II